ncbi:MAG: FAD-dependent thymidylate synthase [Candidatus Aminicenantia bacterium]
MKVILAGYNLDVENIKEIKKALFEVKSYLESKKQTKKGKDLLDKITTLLEKNSLTPETISAAYARISRDPRPVNELREIARQEVEKARKSNVNIIFGLGHSSIAEHAVFNMDIIGVSRYVVEEIERFRLCSYTEKSQRYVLFKDDYVSPKEIRNSPYMELFKETIKLQNDSYYKFFEKLKKYFLENNPNLAREKKSKITLENLAKEDARYVISLATETQLGMTINARNLELIIRRFASHPLSEVQELGEKLCQAVKDIAPSVIKYTQPTEYFKNTREEIKMKSEKIINSIKLGTFELSDKNRFGKLPMDVKLINYSNQGDKILIASLLHSVSNKSMEECLSIANSMDEKQKKEFLKTAFKYIKSYDAVLREFENVDLIFELIVSASCFAQLKRHRMTTILSQDYNPDLGYVIPQSIVEAGMEKEFKRMIGLTNETYYKIKKHTPLAAPYILTNAHQKRVLLKANAREMYHISRLREDKEAQWEIRDKAQKIIKLAKEKFPLAFLLACGKDKFEEEYNKLFKSSQL